MDIYEAIRQRYSVRAYKNQPIEPEKLDRILEAARIAPSGSNRQLWKFIVVKDPDLRNEIAKLSEQPFIAQAPVVIAAVGLSPERIMSCKIPGDPVDCSIAVTQMMLAATAEGLGSCWIGHFDQEQACKVLGVPATAKVVALLPIGYPDQKARAKSRKPLSEVVSYEKF